MGATDATGTVPRRLRLRLSLPACNGGNISKHEGSYPGKVQPMKPLCFVLMPFGQKQDAGGKTIDFNAVYRELITPAIADAGLEAIRADEERVGGIIHKPMFERLILCEFAVADLTTANANVFYELGVRHAVRPASTVLLFSGNSRLPFDVGLLRALPYWLTSAGLPDRIPETKQALTELLKKAGEPGGEDSPIYQLIEGFPDIQRLKTDVFRERVAYEESIKSELVDGRRKGGNAVQAIEQKLEPLSGQESGVLVDLFLSYRAVEAWDRMVALYERMPRALSGTTLVREQYGFALNRLAGQARKSGNRVEADGLSQKAESILDELITKRGPSSETYGILGRVYKDRWEAAVKDKQAVLARAWLDKAIAAYTHGFEADWRDAYPGINAVTLMTVRDQVDPRRDVLLPVVRYAAERRIASGRADYWDRATLLETYVLLRQSANAESALGEALAIVRESWEPDTTANNLRLIREARAKRGTMEQWMKDIEDALVAEGARRRGP
jgi:hypothetical protein